jgi:hypothetical protein
MRLSFFLDDCLRGQSKHKLATIVVAQADPVSVCQHSHLGWFAVNEDAAALTAIFDENPGSTRGNGCALARDTQVVE